MAKYDPFKLNEFEWEVLKCYIKHEHGNEKVYNTSFFQDKILNDEIAVLTLQQFAERALDYDDNLWIEKDRDPELEIGDKVYFIIENYTGKYIKCQKISRIIIEEKSVQYEIPYRRFTDRDIGDTVFLRRLEAQIAGNLI